MGRDREELRDDVRVNFNAFNEGTRLIHCLKMHKRLFGVEAKKVGGDTGYAGEGDTDRGLVRHTERALRPEASQGSDEVDGNPVHLLRHPHSKRGAAGRQDRAESTVGGLLKRKYAHRTVLSHGNYTSAIENGHNIRPKRPE